MVDPSQPKRARLAEALACVTDRDAASWAHSRVVRVYPSSVAYRYPATGMGFDSAARPDTTEGR